MGINHGQLNILILVDVSVCSDELKKKINMEQKLFTHMRGMIG